MAFEKLDKLALSKILAESGCLLPCNKAWADALGGLRDDAQGFTWLSCAFTRTVKVYDTEMVFFDRKKALRMAAKLGWKHAIEAIIGSDPLFSVYSLSVVTDAIRAFLGRPRKDDGTGALEVMLGYIERRIGSMASLKHAACSSLRHDMYDILKMACGRAGTLEEFKLVFDAVRPCIVEDYVNVPQTGRVRYVAFLITFLTFDAGDGGSEKLAYVLESSGKDREGMMREAHVVTASVGG